MAVNVNNFNNILSICQFKHDTININNWKFNDYFQTGNTVAEYFPIYELAMELKWSRSRKTRIRILIHFKWGW